MDRIAILQTRRSIPKTFSLLLALYLRGPQICIWSLIYRRQTLGQMEIDLGEKPIAMEAGLRFAVREGGRTVGSGVVTEILA